MSSRPREFIPSATMTTCRSDTKVRGSAQAAPSEAHVGKEGLLVLPALDDHPRTLPRVDVSEHLCPETHSDKIETRFHTQQAEELSSVSLQEGRAVQSRAGRGGESARCTQPETW